MAVSQDTRNIADLAQLDPDEILDGLNETIAGRMPSYRDLYLRWERLNWRVSDLDFTQDRHDWLALDDLHRERLLWTLAAFYVAEQRVAATLTPYVTAAPKLEQKIFLTTQLVDEQRHAVFFDRWFHEVVETAEPPPPDGKAAGAGDISVRLKSSRRWVGPGFAPLFDEYLEGITSELRANPGDIRLFAKAIAVYHIVIEGVLALTGQKFILAWARNNGILPGFRAGFTAVARDESRHVAFGARVIRDLLTEEPSLLVDVHEGIRETLRLGTALYQPPGGDVTYTSAFGYSLGDLFNYGGIQLEKKMRAIGMPAPHIDVFAPPIEAEWPPPGGGLIATDLTQRAMSVFIRAFTKAAPTFAPGVSLMMLYFGFRPEVARGVDAVWEFHLSGTGGGIFNVEVKDGTCRVNIGKAARRPDVIYELEGSTWAEMTAGRATGDEAVLLGKLRIRGDVTLGRTFNDIFAPPGDPPVRAASLDRGERNGSGLRLPVLTLRLGRRLMGRVIGRERAA